MITRVPLQGGGSERSRGPSVGLEGEGLVGRCCANCAALFTLRTEMGALSIRSALLRTESQVIQKADFGSIPIVDLRCTEREIVAAIADACIARLCPFGTLHRHSAPSALMSVMVPVSRTEPGRAEPAIDQLCTRHATS